MRVLALDLGTNAGWAVSAPNEVEVSGGVNLAHRADAACEPEKRDGKRFDRWSSELVRILEDHKPDHVVVESATLNMHKGRAALVLLGLRGATLVVLERHEVTYAEVSPATWQKWAKRNGWVKGTDENDALHIARWWIEQQIAGVLA